MKILTQLVFSLVLLIGFSCFLLACSGMHTSNNCAQYREGTFNYHFKDKQKAIIYSMVRNDSIQTEKNNENENIAKYNIHWTDECSYELSFIEGTEMLPKEILDLKRKMIVHTTILSGTNNYYLFKSTSNLNDHVLTDTIWLAK